jgi:GTP pyrophosphokinase
MDNTLAIPRYNLSEDEEKKEILRQYRALLRALKPKLKPGDKELLRTAFEMAANATQNHAPQKRRALYFTSPGGGR